MHESSVYFQTFPLPLKLQGFVSVPHHIFFFLHVSVCLCWLLCCFLWPLLLDDGASSFIEEEEEEEEEDDQESQVSSEFQLLFMAAVQIDTQR